MKSLRICNGIPVIALTSCLAGCTTAPINPPAETITATLHLGTFHQVGDIVDFDRAKFINMHSSQSEGEWDSPEMMDQFLNGWDVSLGREVGQTLEYANRVEEDPNRSGYPSIAHIEKMGLERRKHYAANQSRHPYESRNELIVSTHIHPFYPDGTPTKQGWAFANPEATGTFLAHYFKNFFSAADGIHGEPEPIYFEVINEPVYELIDNRGESATTTREEIFEYHNTIADSVRSLNPGIKIGGFTQASPDHEQDDFAHWRKNWERFIDIAGANMDFFSIHLYDKGWDRGNQYIKKGANLEAVLDLIEQASWVKLGAVKPFLISEYGAFDAAYAEDPYAPERDWINLKAYSSMMLNFMERPNHIEKSMPFMIMKAKWWQHPSGQPYAYRLLREENGEWVYTELAKFYQLWSDVNGARLLTESSDPDIQIDAYLAGDQAFLILDNLNFEPTTVDLNIDALKSNTVRSVSISHLHAPDGKPTLSESTLTQAPKQVEIGAEAMMILEYTFDHAPQPAQTATETKYYAQTYLQAIERSALHFEVNDIATGKGVEATLRLGLGRSHNKSLQPKVLFNGHPIEVPQDFRGYDQLIRPSFFGVIEIPVPAEYVQSKNTITMQFPDAGGHVSSLALQYLKSQ